MQRQGSLVFELAASLEFTLVMAEHHFLVDDIREIDTSEGTYISQHVLRRTAMLGVSCENSVPQETAGISIRNFLKVRARLVCDGLQS